jgi:orotate phosphoribosyltransferase
MMLIKTIYNQNIADQRMFMDRNSQILEFLISNGVLRFGEFLTKSGRQSPYFMNFGSISRGNQIKYLAEQYAHTIINSKAKNANIVFGPSYKGIPIAVTTSTILDMEHDNKSNSTSPVSFCFNRKEVKNRGEGGVLVGKNLASGDKVVIVEDVITAGTTLKEVVPLIRSIPGVEILGVVIAIDREEKINEQDKVTARTRLEAEYEIPIIPIMKITDILNLLKDSTHTDQVNINRAWQYLERYGCL